MVGEHRWRDNYRWETTGDRYSADWKDANQKIPEDAIDSWRNKGGGVGEEGSDRRRRNIAFLRTRRVASSEKYSQRVTKELVGQKKNGRVARNKASVRGGCCSIKKLLVWQSKGDLSRPATRWAHAIAISAPLAPRVNKKARSASASTLIIINFNVHTSQSNHIQANLFVSTIFDADFLPEREAFWRKKTLFLRRFICLGYRAGPFLRYAPFLSLHYLWAFLNVFNLSLFSEINSKIGSHSIFFHQVQFSSKKFYENFFIH